MKLKQRIELNDLFKDTKAILGALGISIIGANAIFINFYMAKDVYKYKMSHLVSKASVEIKIKQCNKQCVF